jgi:DNA-binding PadR family transcriptional regulator
MGNLYRFLEPMVLYLLKKGGPSYGYELARSLKDHVLTDSAIDAPVLYRTLRQLELNGHVTSTWDVMESGPARHNYG